MGADPWSAEDDIAESLQRIANILERIAEALEKKE